MLGPGGFPTSSHHIYDFFSISERSYFFTSERCVSIKSLHRVFSSPVWLPKPICRNGQILGQVMMIFMMTIDIMLLWSNHDGLQNHLSNDHVHNEDYHRNDHIYDTKYHIAIKNMQHRGTF